MRFALYSAEEGGGAPSEQDPAPEATSAPDPGATPEADATPQPAGIEINGQSYTPEEVQSWQTAHTNMKDWQASNTQRAQEAADGSRANAELARELQTLRQSMQAPAPIANQPTPDLSDPVQMRKAVQQDVRELIAPIQSHIDAAQQTQRQEQDAQGLVSHGENVDRVAGLTGVNKYELYRRVMEQGGAGQTVEFFASQLAQEASAAKMGTSPAGANGAPADPPSGGAGSAAKSPFKPEIRDRIEKIDQAYIDEVMASSKT